MARRLLMLLGAVLLSALAGCDGPVATPTPLPTLVPTPDKAALLATLVAGPTPDVAAIFATIGAGLGETPTPHVPQLFGGSGDKASDTFSLSKGTARITLTHTGNLNFIVELLNSDGTVAELLVNQVGPYDGSTVVNIPAPATYILKVRADGEWVVSIEQQP